MCYLVCVYVCVHVCLCTAHIGSAAAVAVTAAVCMYYGQLNETVSECFKLSLFSCP